MRQATWRVGLYAKVVLMVIAVSLVGLLARQLPKKMEARAEGTANVRVLAMHHDSLRGLLEELVTYEKKKGSILDQRARKLAKKALEDPSISSRSVLEWVLTYEYALGYRVKCMTNEFIILEAE